MGPRREKSLYSLKKAWEEPKPKRETHPHQVDLYERDIMFYVVTVVTHKFWHKIV